MIHYLMKCDVSIAVIFGCYSFSDIIMNFVAWVPAKIPQQVGDKCPVTITCI